MPFDAIRLVWIAARNPVDADAETQRTAPAGDLGGWRQVRVLPLAPAQHWPAGAAGARRPIGHRGSGRGEFDDRPSIVVPGASPTTIAAFNSAGQIAGFYVATPTELATVRPAGCGRFARVVPTHAKESSAPECAHGCSGAQPLR